MYSKENLKPGMKLRATEEYREMVKEDVELEVIFPTETICVVKSLSTGEEKTPRYEILSTHYEIVPELEPSEENFIPRTYMICEEMIAFMSAYNQTGSQTAMIELGTRLHALKDEAASFLDIEEEVLETGKSILDM